jgi:arginine/ornithine N-succinyltransferase beta subunit
MSTFDYRSTRLDKTQARKLVTEIMSRYPSNVRFSKHARKELAKDDLTTVDALNVLKSSSAHIKNMPDFKDGSWRYTVETNLIGICVAFDTQTSLAVVSGWRK